MMYSNTYDRLSVPNNYGVNNNFAYQSNYDQNQIYQSATIASPQFSTNVPQYSVTQMQENEFEQILVGKQNEIEYWKIKNAKMQKQFDESENKVTFISTEYDKLRVQYMQLESSVESLKQPLEFEIEQKNMSIKSLQSQLETLNQLNTKNHSDYNECLLQKNENELKVLDLQRQIQDLQRQVQDLQFKNLNMAQNAVQEDVVKRAGRHTAADVKHSATSSRVVVVDNNLHNSGNNSEIIKAQFEMIDRQNSTIEYQKQQLKYYLIKIIIKLIKQREKEQKIIELQQQLWQIYQNQLSDHQFKDYQELHNSSKGRSVFC